MKLLSLIIALITFLSAQAGTPAEMQAEEQTDAQIEAEIQTEVPVITPTVGSGGGGTTTVGVRVVPPEPEKEFVKELAESPEVALAKCLTEKGITLFASATCGHCQNQKALFGDALKYIQQVECYRGAENADLQACAAAKIRAFPTWVMADGTKIVGMQPLSLLAEKTGCEY